MCWLNRELIPIKLKKPLKVYKIGTRLTKRKFVTAYKKYTYTKHTKLPTIQLTPDLYVKQSGGYMYRIFEGYHAFLTLDRAESELYMDYDCIGEFVRPLTQKEKDESPDRWDFWYQVGDLVNAFESLEELEGIIKNFKKKFSPKVWEVKVIRKY